MDEVVTSLRCRFLGLASHCWGSKMLRVSHRMNHFWCMLLQEFILFLQINSALVSFATFKNCWIWNLRSYLCDTCFIDGLNEVLLSVVVVVLLIVYEQKVVFLRITLWLGVISIDLLLSLCLVESILGRSLILSLHIVRVLLSHIPGGMCRSLSFDRLIRSAHHIITRTCSESVAN